MSDSRPSALRFTPYGWPEPGPDYLAPTAFLDHDHPRVRDFVATALGDDGASASPRDRAIRLFVAVRDAIRYDPYQVDLEGTGFRASEVLRLGSGFCVPKAVLLAACARSAGIPAAIGTSDVVNHFTSPKLLERMGGHDVFMHHGWAALHLDGQWVKAVPAFNRELCERMGVPPTDFDGVHDAVLQTFDANGRQVMSYLKDHGVWSDLPLARIRADYEAYYPMDRLSRPASDEVFEFSPRPTDAGD
ncbi:MAG: transglutaminase family protein [Burkholderiaceae bacterium]